MSESAKRRTIILIEMLCLFVMSMLVRTLHVDIDPITDELYHILAAQSWLDNGSFSILDGQYDRAALYTMFVGIVSATFDGDISSIRVSSAVLVSLWIVGIFLWCRLRLGRVIAWIAALLMCFGPGAIFISQYIRFYAMHGLLFWLVAIATYELISGKGKWKSRTAIAMGAVVLTVLSIHLQQTTYIGIAALMAYIGITNASQAFSLIKSDRFHGGLLLASVLVLLVAIVFTIQSGLLAKTLHVYQWTPLWIGNSGLLYYPWLLMEQYPVIWIMMPLTLLIVIARKSSPGIFCAVVFVVGLLLHSFAGMKAERFIYYLMPFFFILGAILFDELLNLARRLWQTGLDSLTELNISWRRRLNRLEPAYIAVLATILVLVNPAHRATADMLRGKEIQGAGGNVQYWSTYTSDWESAQRLLLPLLKNADVIITTQGLHLAYYLGRFDFELSATRLSDLYDGDWDVSKEFTMDYRTGRPVISSAESLNKIHSCFANGLVVVRTGVWRNRAFITDVVADYIETNTKRVDWPEEQGLLVFIWETPAESASSDCENLFPHA